MIINPRPAGQIHLPSADGGNSSSVYKVTQTVIDGKKTLILDQRDIQRIINANPTNGSTCSVVLQHGTATV